MNLFEALQKSVEMCPDTNDSEQKLNDMYPDPQQWADAALLKTIQTLP